MTAKIMPFPAQVEPEQEAGKVRVYLGCNQNPLEGWINVDIVKYPGVDVQTDLEKKWPWEDNSVDEIYTADLPEHLRNWYETYDFSGVTDMQDLMAALQKPVRHYGVFHFMNEAWRVLKPDGLLRARIPTTESKAWAQDPTHVSFWNENTLLYFTHPTYRGIYPNDIKANFTVVEAKTLMPNQYGEAWFICVLKKIA